jgi:hypothetical protein
MISRVLLVLFTIYFGMANARINSKVKKTDVSEQIQTTSKAQKYWDVGEDRELYRYSSASYGYHGSARNNALFYRKKEES